MRAPLAVVAASLLTLAACGQSSGAPGSTEAPGGQARVTTVPVKQVLTTGGPLPATPVTGTGGAGSLQAPSTRPQIAPALGGPGTRFVVTLTARAALGAQGAIATEYRVLGTGPPGTRCDRATVSTITRARFAQHLRVTLRPSSNGWCRGRWRGEVVLVRGPSCHSGPGTGLTPECPKFASRLAEAGRFRWRVR